MTNPATLLVVDDNPDNLELLVKQFSDLGYRVVTAVDGLDALEKFGAEPPDLVILDVMMPRMDGFEVCHRLKSDPATRRVPVILLTARTDVPDKVRGFDTGADDYVTKPFSLRELVARVEGLLQRSINERRAAAAEKLKALDDMTEGVAHEVRNPMVAIGGFARRIHRSLKPEDPLREYAGLIIKEVERLERMVDAVVRYKALMVLPYERVDLSSLARETLGGFATRCADLGVRPVLEVPAAPLVVEGDRGNLGLALGNLIQNSLEAMEEGGGVLTVRVESSPRRPNHAVVEVADTGRGIRREELSHVIEPFQTTKSAGAGIGLTMAHHIVIRHQGELDIQSREGEGTTVTLLLPLRQERMH